jgi:hypothetical protein
MYWVSWPDPSDTTTTKPKPVGNQLDGRSTEGGTKDLTRWLYLRPNVITTKTVVRWTRRRHRSQEIEEVVEVGGCSQAYHRIYLFPSQRPHQSTAPCTAQETTTGWRSSARASPTRQETETDSSPKHKKLIYKCAWVQQ